MDMNQLTSPPALALFCGIALTLVAAYKLLRPGTNTSSDDDFLPEEIELRELAKRAKWLSQPDLLAGLHVREMSSLWRDPGGYTDENYARKIRIRDLDQFYGEMVKHAYWFQTGPYRSKQRAVILQLLELLDKYHPTPSVAKVYDSQTDTDGQWGPSFGVLSKVTLVEHLLNACEMGVSHLIRNNETHRIPNAIIALLAHDIGKLPATQTTAFRGQYGTGDHPVTGAKLLASLPHFSGLAEEARREILHAVLFHHNANPQEGTLTHLVQMADRSARHAEFRVKNQAHTAPEWILNSRIMPRDLAYSVLIPSQVQDDPDLRLAERQINPLAGFSAGVLGDMNNIFYNAEQASPHQETPPVEPVTPVEPVEAPLMFGLDPLNLGAAPTPPPPAETGEEPLPSDNLGLDDPCWEKVQDWVERGIDANTVVDPQTIQKKFRIKKHRAAAIFEALVDNGFLVIEDPAEPPPEQDQASFLPESEPVTTAAAEADIPLGPEPPEIAPESEDNDLPPDFIFQVPTVVAPPPVEEETHPQQAEQGRAGGQTLADISAWFRPDLYLQSVRDRIDRAWRWSKTSGASIVDRELVEVTESGVDGTFYWGVTTKHHTWLNIMALRQLAAEQMHPHSPEGAIALFEGKGAGGDQDFQDLILKAIVGYYQRTGIIDTGLLPIDSPFYSLNCEVVVSAGTRQGNRRMVPFHWHNFYEKWEDVAKRRSKYPFVNRIKDVRPAPETQTNFNL